MAKGTGLIGNFKGKVGNMVGYNLKDSNNKQTQGIRVYQPVVRNPKSYAQAQQRCIMQPINQSYRLFKEVITRGYEGVSYGNASRLVWLKDAMKGFTGPWVRKGIANVYPVDCQMTKGSLPAFSCNIQSDNLRLYVDGVVAETAVATVGALSTLLLEKLTYLQEGDQITIVGVNPTSDSKPVAIESIVIKTTSSVALQGITTENNRICFDAEFLGLEFIKAGFIVLSREGSNGAHLRSSQFMRFDSDWQSDVQVYDGDNEVAIRSYMATGTNADWPQEALEG